MEITKAKKEYFKDYLFLKRKEERDYSKITGRKIKYPTDKILRKEFNESISSDKNLILFAKENKEMIGYIQCNYTKNPYSKLGYIDDLFVLKKFRRKGIATKLIVEFTKILKKKGYKKLQMSVNTRNTNAISLYKKLGFEIFHYGLRKEWK